MARTYYGGFTKDYPKPFVPLILGAYVCGLVIWGLTSIGATMQEFSDWVEQSIIAPQKWLRGIKPQEWLRDLMWAEDASWQHTRKRAKWVSCILLGLLWG